MQPPFLFRTPDPLVCHPPCSSPPHALRPPPPSAPACLFPFPVLLSSWFPHPFVRLSLTRPLDPPPQWPEETSAQGFRQLLELNLLGTYTLTKVRLGSPPPGLGDLLTMSFSDPLCLRAKCFVCLALILFRKGSVLRRKEMPIDPYIQPKLPVLAT